MTWRYYKRISLIPGFLYLNIGRRGWSISVGVRGLHWTFGPGKDSISIGIPGSGLSWRKRIR